MATIQQEHLSGNIEIFINGYPTIPGEVENIRFSVRIEENLTVRETRIIFRGEELLCTRWRLREIGRHKRMLELEVPGLPVSPVNVFSVSVPTTAAKIKTKGDRTCKNNALSPYLQCAVNPSGECANCSDYEARTQ